MTLRAGAIACLFMLQIFKIGYAAAAEPPRPADVRVLLHANGVENIAGTIAPLVAQQLTLMFHQQNPNLSQRADEIIEKATISYMNNQSARDHLIDQLVPIYSKYLSKDDVRQLTNFYQSSIGRKLASVMPVIDLESANIGRAWAQGMLPGLEAHVRSTLKQENLIQ
jgi:hypothetical protein